MLRWQCTMLVPEPCCWDQDFRSGWWWLLWSIQQKGLVSLLEGLFAQIQLDSTQVLFIHLICARGVVQWDADLASKHNGGIWKGVAIVQGAQQVRLKRVWQELYQKEAAKDNESVCYSPNQLTKTPTHISDQINIPRSSSFIAIGFECVPSLHKPPWYTILKGSLPRFWKTLTNLRGLCSQFS